MGINHNVIEDYINVDNIVEDYITFGDNVATYRFEATFVIIMQFHVILTQ